MLVAQKIYVLGYKNTILVMLSLQKRIDRGRFYIQRATIHYREQESEKSKLSLGKVERVLKI